MNCEPVLILFRTIRENVSPRMAAFGAADGKPGSGAKVILGSASAGSRWRSSPCAGDCPCDIARATVRQARKDTQPLLTTTRIRKQSLRLNACARSDPRRCASPRPTHRRAYFEWLGLRSSG